MIQEVLFRLMVAHTWGGDLGIWIEHFLRVDLGKVKVNVQILIRLRIPLFAKIRINFIQFNCGFRTSGGFGLERHPRRAFCESDVPVNVVKLEIWTHKLFASNPLQIH